MRIGGQIFDEFDSPEEWIKGVKGMGYNAAYCPVAAETGDDIVRAHAEAALKNDIIIAEVGAWSNPISKDEGIREKAIKYCQSQLELAERIGARCCVNIAGSRGEKWDGPHEDNFREDTFDLIVDTVRTIIDGVKPKRTFFTLETMPWIFPDSPENYIKLIEAIDRKEFAVHLDVVNLITSPRRYYNNGDLIRECFRVLGPYIKSCHGKDIIMGDGYMVHLDEVRPGLGKLDYVTLLREIGKLKEEIPLMLEHLPNKEEYELALKYVVGLQD